MKKNVLLLAALGMTVVGFAQKTEIKEAKKALKKGDAQTALTQLNAAEGVIDSADDKTQATYYQLLGDAYTSIAKAGDSDAFQSAINAYHKANADEVAEKLQGISADLVNAAVKDNQEEKYNDAASKLYLSYSISPKDTLFLYYAASSAVSGRDYDTALNYYEMLKDLNYDGSEMKYTAVDVETGERTEMPKAQRDIMVKAGTYKDPKDEKSDSKRAEIIKNIALIYTQQGEDDKAMEAYIEARKTNPSDVTLILNQANLYFKQGDKEKFKTMMSEAVKVDPTNPDLYYNIGVINMEQGDLEAARSSYLKSIELDPNYINAILNLSTSYVNEGNGLVEQMNAIRGNSAKDIAKYDALKAQKEDLFKQAAVVLEDGLKTNPGNMELLEQLKNIYGALSDFANYKRIQDMMDQ